MNMVIRSVSIVALAFVMIDCSKSKSPAADDSANTATAASAQNVLSMYDANNITQIQFEVGYGAMPGPVNPSSIRSKILIFVVNGQTVTNSGIYLQDQSNRSCTASVQSFSPVSLYQNLAAASLGVRPVGSPQTADGGYDRLSLFFKDGSSVAVPFNSDGVAPNTTVILEGTNAPLDNFLRNIYASGTCTPN